MSANSQSEMPVWKSGWLTLRGARHNNLKSIDVSFPLAAFTAVTGVSGSGKSSLVEDILYGALARRLHHSQSPVGAYDSIDGIHHLNKVIQVDQRPLGQTPTSNPATYTGLFELIRQLFSQLPESRLRGFTPRRFSFNVPGGRCEKCEGAGQRLVEMHFLADVWIVCDQCEGKRYDKQTLEVKFRDKSIADVLEMSCQEALVLFAGVPKIARILRTLCDVGLDYIALGQSATTLSGGEAQRVKLAAELSRPDTGRTLYLLDEPTTGLHFEDLKKLIDVLQRLVDLGNTVIVIEHNLDMIKSADRVIDMGPEAGLEGGHLVFAGSPEQLADYSRQWLKATAAKKKKLLRSYTGEALIPVLKEVDYQVRPIFDAKEYAGELLRMEQSELVSTELLDPIEALMPWTSDGRAWHTKNRVSRTGTSCKWDGRVLNEVMDRIEDSRFFAPIDWNNRTVVEVRGENRAHGWFLHALTGEEWLLKLRFRVPKNSFKKEWLVTRLNLRPLNEMDDIPLYGTQSRVRVDMHGHWQEIELKLHSYNEVDRDEFRDFLDLAIAQFGNFIDQAKEKQVDYTPWRNQGEQWHLTPDNCHGADTKPKWKIALLEMILAIVTLTWSDLKPNWTNKVLVPFGRKNALAASCRVFTKNCEFVTLQLNVPKNSVPLGRILHLGFEPEVDGSNAGYDALYLRFRNESDLNYPSLLQFVREIKLI